MKKNTVLRVIRIALATMITASTVTVNVRAMDGEVFENIENDQEDVNTNEEVYNESVEEAMEAETAAEESVEEAVEISTETIESIAEGNEEAGIEAADVTDGGAVAQESVEAFVEAVESLPVEENLNEAVAELNEVTEELVKVDEADRAADESAEETVANVAGAKEYIEHTKLTLKQNYESNPTVVQLTNTKMDQVIKEDKKMNIKPEKYVTQLLPKKKLYLTEAERDRDIVKQEKLLQQEAI